MSECSFPWPRHVALYGYRPSMRPMVGTEALCFFLALVTNAAVNICIQVFMLVYIFISLGHTPRGGVAGLYGNSVFNILRTCHAVFQSTCPFTCSLACGRVPVFPRPHQYLPLPVCFVLQPRSTRRGVSLCLGFVFPTDVMLSIFSCACWPFLYLIWNSVCTNVCSFFSVDYFCIDEL